MRLIDADSLLSFIQMDEKVIAPEQHTAQDIIMMIQTAPIIAPPSNAPLTLEELREMDGEPVYLLRDSSRAEQAEGDLSLAAAGLEREKILASKLDQAIQDLYFVMADGDACKVCKSKCLMGTADACYPHWKGLDE